LIILTESYKCHEVTNVPTIKYNFVPLNMLEELNKDAICGRFNECHQSFGVSQVHVDVIGVVKEAGPLAEITTKMAKQVSR